MPILEGALNHTFQIWESTLVHLKWEEDREQKEMTWYMTCCSILMPYCRTSFLSDRVQPTDLRFNLTGQRLFCTAVAWPQPSETLISQVLFVLHIENMRGSGLSSSTGAWITRIVSFPERTWGACFVSHQLWWWLGHLKMSQDSCLKFWASGDPQISLVSNIPFSDMNNIDSLTFQLWNLPFHFFPP